VSKISLFLLSGSTVVGSLLLMLMDKPAQAATIGLTDTTNNIQKAPQANLGCDRANCTGNKYLAEFTQTFSNQEANDFSNVQETPEGHLILNISEEESDAAIALFGCDCITSVNALRQTRGIAVGVEGDQILPGPQIIPCTVGGTPGVEGYGKPLS
jgi:hypothetical protein